jgi:hypothetical protein
MDYRDEQLMELVRHEPYAVLGMDSDSELGFVGIRALRELAEFCEIYQVRRLREAGIVGRGSPLGQASAPRRYTKNSPEP